jgi:hypothetical protein
VAAAAGLLVIGAACSSSSTAAPSDADSAFSLPPTTVGALTASTVARSTLTTGSAPTTPSSTTTAARAGLPGPAGGTVGRSTRPTIPPVQPARHVQWSATPQQITLAAGGHAAGFVFARNLDAIRGTVVSPGCPQLVGHPPVSLSADHCPPANRTTSIAGLRAHKWSWVWNATSDGTRTGAPLAPGAYTLKIGGATVAITVT